MDDRAFGDDMFVALPVTTADGSKSWDRYLCNACLRKHAEVDIGDDEVLCWDLDSDGWLGPIACSDCKTNIPITVGDADDHDSPEDEITEVIPDMDAQVRELDASHARPSK